MISITLLNLRPGFGVSRSLPFYTHISDAISQSVNVQLCYIMLFIRIETTLQMTTHLQSTLFYPSKY